MLFRPKSIIGANNSEKKLWEALKIALEQEPGVTYFGFRPRNRNGHIIKESDILILHQKFGICVIECKGCRIDRIKSINGEEWHMEEGNGWYRKTMQPLTQAKDAMFAVVNELDYFIKYELNRSKPLRINNAHLVALPFITRQQWQDRRFDNLPTTRGAVLLKEDLTPENIRQKLAERVIIQQSKISDGEWKEICSFCTQDSVREKIKNRLAEQNDVVTLMNRIQYSSFILDNIQKKIATEIPPGPQRLRGLAGTGKTVLLAMRAAKMHYEHPDWNIAFVFYTKSLYQQTLTLIDNAYRELFEEHNLEPQSPNWNKLKVLPAWGGKTVGQGFYYDLAIDCRVTPIRWQKYIKFEDVCDRLEEKSKDNFSTLYDAIIIDEGQDLPPSFYRLAYKTLSEPKRLYWAYDEAQGLSSLVIPDSESIFGRKEKTKKLLVDLRGQYEGGISKSCIMNSCYRTPRLLLMTAHAINMGLFRQGGVLQGVTTKADWQNLGYEIHGDSDFSSSSVKAGKTITITRPDKTSPHEVDRENFDLKNVAGSLLIAQTFNSVFAERQWIVEEIVKDINVRGFEPEDILITGVCGNNDDKFYKYIRETLQKKGVETFYAGEETKTVFRQNGCVTISSIYRAKGNEAWKVYVCRFEYSDRPLNWKKPQESELHKRNEAFTALTRAKAWCVVTGLHSPVFNELYCAIAQYPNFTFPAFNKKSLKRITDDENSNSSSLEYRDRLQPPKIYTLSDLDRKSKKIKPLLKPKVKHKAQIENKISGQ